MKEFSQNRFLRKFCHWFSFAGGCIQIFALIVVIVMIVARSMFHVGISGAQELAALLMMVFASAGVAEALIKNGHVQMTAIIDIVPKKVRAIMNIFIYGVGTVYLTFYVYAAWFATIRAYTSGDRMVCMAVLYTWWARAIYAFGFTLFLLVMVLKLIDAVRAAICMFQGKSIDSLDNNETTGEVQV